MTTITMHKRQINTHDETRKSLCFIILVSGNIYCRGIIRHQLCSVDFSM